MAKKKILVVDDDTDFINLVKMNLEQTGKYDVRIEDKGGFALSAVMTFKPDLILLDIVMGDRDGYQVATEIRNSEFSKDIPIIYVTAIINKKEEKKLHDFLGGHPLLAKPITTERLVESIEEHI